MDDTDVINFLLQTEIIPLCLRIMERGTELSKTVATFIIQKILLDDQGLHYLCQTAERFFAVSTVLNNMVQTQKENPSPRLLKHIIRCYTRLAENPRALIALRENLPKVVSEKNLLEYLDESTKKCLKNLNDNLQPEGNERQEEGDRPSDPQSQASDQPQSLESNKQSAPMFTPSQQMLKDPKLQQVRSFIPARPGSTTMQEGSMPQAFKPGMI